MGADVILISYSERCFHLWFRIDNQELMFFFSWLTAFLKLQNVKEENFLFSALIRFPTWKKNEGNKITSYLCIWYPYLQEIIDGPQILWLQSLWVFVMHRHETPQIEIPSAHDNSVWDLAWHPIGYLLCRCDNLVAYFTYGIISSYWFQIWTLVFNLVYPRLFKLWTSGRINWVLNNHVIN